MWPHDAVSLDLPRHREQVNQIESVWKEGGGDAENIKHIILIYNVYW